MNEIEVTRDPLPIVASGRVTARALLIGDRIDTNGLERSDMISAAPLAFRIGDHGAAALFRFGVIVLVGLTPIEEDDLLSKISARVSGKRERFHDETPILDIASEHDDRIPPGGPIQIKALSPSRFLVIADALAKSVSLGRHEREVSAVFDVIEPFALELAAKGRPPVSRRSMLKLMVRRCSSSIASPAVSRSRKNRTCCGIAPISNASMRGSRTNMNSRNGPGRQAQIGRHR